MRKLTFESGIFYTGNQRILKSHNCYPYKKFSLHELKDYLDRFLQLCERIGNQTGENKHFSFKTCFSDELFWKSTV